MSAGTVDPIREASGQLASWLRFRLTSGSPSLDEAVESGMPGAWPGKASFIQRLGSARAIVRRDEADLADRIASDPWFRRWGAERVRRWRHLPQPAEMVARWEGLPILNGVADLADWLGIPALGELHWLAGIERGGEEVGGRLGHYTYRWIPRKHGASPRLLASPKPRLKAAQHRILRGILERVPLHDAAHGFRRGRSILTFAEVHVRRDCVLRADLAEFFPSIRFGRVAAFFETAGYPSSVARLLAGLCCHAPPRSLVREAGLPPSEVARWTRPHLPQGAPTSPALSNALAFRFDRRLAGLAAAAGADYTRYADDLAFSGGDGLRRGAARFLDRVAAIALEEGFELNYRKSRVMPACARQRLAGVVVNERPNTTRATYDELKAILHRWETRGLAACAGDDPVFAERLLGRIAALGQLNLEKGGKLRLRFERLRSA